MRPHHKGADMVVPDDIADQMIAAGDAENPRPFPLQADDAAVPPPAKSYQTKGAAKRK
jgi:hypothetical protein